MDFQVPQPTVDIEAIREKYHSAAGERKRLGKSHNRRTR